MYAIYRDGQLLYQSGAEDEAHLALNVRLSLDIEGAGSLSFVLPPGNAQYNSIVKMKSIITMVQDGVQLFRGRVLDDERDAFNQKSIYCEGDQSFLLDSLWEEQTYKGKVQAFFRSLISNHNNQVEEKKRFSVGIITAVSAEEPYNGEIRVETRRFWDTSTVISDRLMNVYGGYLRTRTDADGTNYIDWLSDFTENAAQPIRFGVNMLDLTEKLDASDMFTCLIPLGHSEVKDDGTYDDPVNITSVNGGVEYLQDAEAVEKYGRIWRQKTWGNEKDPAKLKQKAQEYLKTGAEFRTLTLTALDMHFADDSIDMIRIGTRVQISSNPHGINLRMVCAKMDIDPDNPENTRYTFGVKPRTLSEAVIRNKEDTDKINGTSGRGGGRSIQKEQEDIMRWARITVNKATSQIGLNAGLIDKTRDYMAAAGININGELAQVEILAKKQTVDDLTGRVSNAESSIKANAEHIELKVSKGDIASTINQTAQSVLISADKIDLEGYVTVDELAAHIADITSLDVTILKASQGIETQGLNVKDRFHFLGSQVSKTTIPVVTSFTQASGESAGTTDYTLLTTAVGDATTHSVAAGEMKTF